MSYVDGGAATALLSGLGEGEEVTASGPYGRFCLHDADNNRRYLLVATGTGVTPYRAMLPLLEQQIATRNTEVVCIFCGLCEEACPVDAIVETRVFEYHGEKRGDLYYTKDMLLAMGDKHEEQIAKDRAADAKYR